MIADKNFELARIRCEHVIRSDFVVEAYSIVKLLLEILAERASHVTGFFMVNGYRIRDYNSAIENILDIRDKLLSLFCFLINFKIIDK